MKYYLTLFAVLFCFSNSADELIHTYTFETDLSDAIGSVELIGNGGTVSGGRYYFGANQGLTLNSGLPDTSQYSIEMHLQFASLEPFYKKLIDFQNLTDDAGLYIRGDGTRFYPEFTLGAGVIESGEDFHIVLTRSTDNIVRVYLNGELQTEDTSTYGISSENILNFLIDDFMSIEAGIGSIDYIRIYDGPLSADQVASLLPPYARGELLHTYTFDNNYHDSTGSVDLFNTGGVIQDGRFQFNVGEGLVLVDGLPDASQYTIEMKMQYESLEPYWKKVIDFQSLQTDSGLYIADDVTVFYSFGQNGIDMITAGEDFHLVLTRTEDDLIKVYLNGVLQSETVTSAGESADNVVNFFLDDVLTSFEAAPGSVDYIRVFFGALAPSEISNLTPPAPAQAVVVRDLFSEGDGLLTYDSSTNLEWLDLTQTIGLSINNIQSEPNPWVPEGFSVASRAQVVDFFQSLGIRDVGFNTVVNAAGVINHLDLVGCTWSCQGTSFQRASGISMNENQTSGASSTLDIIFNATPDTGRATFTSTVSLDDAFISVGIYLVREAEFADSDGDTLLDINDNCSLVSNADQRDSDGDGYGNICDPDLNNDGIVNFLDVGIWTNFFGSADNEDTDFNGDGATNFLDFAVLVNYIFSAPGPGAVAP